MSIIFKYIRWTIEEEGRGRSGCEGSALGWWNIFSLCYEQRWLEQPRWGSFCLFQPHRSNMQKVSQVTPYVPHALCSPSEDYNSGHQSTQICQWQITYELSESLKQDLARVEAEKEATLVQYNQCLETISKLEERIKEVEDHAIRIQEHADIAEKEMKALKLEVTKLNEEKGRCHSPLSAMLGDNFQFGV